jgi:hypothetical protein
MFLSKDYVLANELVQKMEINIANISKLIKDFEYNNFYGDIIKMNNCAFLKKTSHRFPKFIKDGLNNFNFTDISNGLPCRFVQSEYSITERELSKSEIFLEKKKIAKKEFYIFKDDFVQKLKGKIAYTLNKEETEKCHQNGDIQGYIQLSKNKFLTWYSLFN